VGAKLPFPIKLIWTIKLLVLILWTLLVLILKFAKEHNRYVKQIVDGKPITLIKDGQVVVKECLKNGIIRRLLIDHFVLKPPV
jgi:uncharacterized membrane protein YcaP (DUF421 family)